MKGRKRQTVGQKAQTNVLYRRTTARRNDEDIKKSENTRTEGNFVKISQNVK